MLSLTQSANAISPGLPVLLVIPAASVSAGIQRIGVTQSGEMEVPEKITDVGWFKLGSRPGEKGSAVISGHFNGKNGEIGVFSNLNKLKRGDKLYIIDNKGTSFDFIVRKIQAYNPGYAEEIFTLNDISHLNLITCDGYWDKNKKSYNKRLVVFTDLIHETYFPTLLLTKPLKPQAFRSRFRFYLAPQVWQ